MGLAIPLVVAITTAMGANNGILVRDRLALEQAREIDFEEILRHCGAGRFFPAPQ